MKPFQSCAFQTYLFCIFLLVSCATKKDTDFVDFDSEDIEQKLEIDKEKIKRFTTKEVKLPAKTKSKNKTLKNKNEKLNQDKNAFSDKGPKSSLGQKESEEDVAHERSTVLHRYPRSYPKDYPKAFKKYDQQAKKAWDIFDPLVYLGEKFTFKVAYLGITAGHIQMETMPVVEIDNEKAYHFKARMRSARYYSYIYTLDDSLETYITVKDFIPKKYILLQRESAQKVDDLQLFDREELKTYHFYKRLKEGKRKELEIEKPIPFFFQDSYSALHFVRGFPMAKGDMYEFPIVTRGKIWIIKILVEGEETIDVNGKDVRAIRLNAETRFPGVLEKKGDILFWYSADEKKKLLKFEAQVKIGAVSGELVDYVPGTALEAL